MRSQRMFPTGEYQPRCTGKERSQKERHTEFGDRAGSSDANWHDCEDDPHYEVDVAGSQIAVKKSASWIGVARKLYQSSGSSVR